jgi:hypothetical protein
MVQCPICNAQVAANATTCPACGSDASLWLARDNETYGPYNLADLTRARTEGRLSENDLVMIGSHGQWQPFSVLAESLASAVPTAANVAVCPTCGSAASGDGEACAKCGALMPTIDVTGRSSVAEPEAALAARQPSRPLTLSRIILRVALIMIVVSLPLARHVKWPRHHPQPTVVTPPLPGRPWVGTRPPVQTPPLKTTGG